jgi:excisionase family DNA binding protein
MEMEKLYSVPEAAEFLGGISKWTIYSWLSQGRLRRTKIGSRTMLKESELQKLIQDGGKSLTAERPPRGTDNLTGTDDGTNVKRDAATHRKAKR